MRRFLLEGLLRKPLTENAPDPEQAELDALAKAFQKAQKATLGRSLAIRVVDAGSCNGCEMELNALANPYYDLSRFGIHMVASPRHADVLLVTGTMTRNMTEALQRTYDAMPAPKWVVSVGDCTKGGGCFAGSYAIMGGVDAVLPVDLHIPGCAPDPTTLLKGLLALLNKVAAKPA